MPIIKDLYSIEGVPTAHGIGIKQVLLSNGDTYSSITQIAVVSLEVGEFVDEHVHHTMDEHYFLLQGDGEMIIGGKKYDCHEGGYIVVSKGEKHSLKSITKMKFITIGVAYDK